MFCKELIHSAWGFLLGRGRYPKPAALESSLNRARLAPVVSHAQWTRRFLEFLGGTRALTALRLLVWNVLTATNGYRTSGTLPSEQAIIIMVAETKKPVGEDQGRETPYIVSGTFAALRPGEFIFTGSY